MMNGHLGPHKGTGTDPPSVSVSSEVSSDSDSSDDSISEDFENSSQNLSIGTGSMNGSSHDASQQQRCEVKQVRKSNEAETNSIRFWRLVVLGLLIVAGAAVSTGTFIYLTSTQEHTFRNRYHLFILTITDSINFHMSNIHQSSHDLADIITAAALLVPGAAFPFVTVPNFELASGQARVRSGVETVTYCPIVALDQVAAWNQYSTANAATWLQQSRSYLQEPLYEDTTITPMIYDLDNTTGGIVTSPPPGPFSPAWEISPPPKDPALVNYNLMNFTPFRSVLTATSITGATLFSSMIDPSNFYLLQGVDEDDKNHYGFATSSVSSSLTIDELPHSLLIQPVLTELDNKQSGIAGVVVFVVAWDVYLARVLPVGVNGLVGVLSNNCGQSFTYSLDGNSTTWLGTGDLHDPAFESLAEPISLYDYDNDSISSVGGHCQYIVTIYPSNAFKDGSATNVPAIFTAIVAVAFTLVVITFIVYDGFVQRRNNKVVHAAARSNAILSSLFPSNIRDRLFAENENAAVASAKVTFASNTHVPAAKSRLRSFLDNDGAATGVDGGVVSEKLGYEGKPIADLFPETTVMFGDIAGFTAWSSVREPAQVFTLLETLYKAFDEIAHRRRVFKVETVGDCYVAVTGLPDPQKDHAVIMARFARDCMYRTRVLTKKLETSLGPDTGDLNMRMGIHSGQVTGGVLRGERSRFQLFGDTMNTASRMESTGEAGRIQVSQETADLLIVAGKSEWINLREQRIVAKGKGEMQTYWLNLVEPASDSTSSADVSLRSSEGNTEDPNPDVGNGDQAPEDVKAFTISNSRTTRLIEWNVDVLLRLLKQIVARRRACGENPPGTVMANETQFELLHAESGKTAIDEVKEIITLPKYDPKVAMRQEDPDSITLPSEVVDQLHDYVSNIAAIYNDNPFHNFEHASHVTMSVVKLLSRIVAPSEFDFENDDNIKAGQSLHDHTYGITSDPLTQFACVFSALIHDADHSGVPNAQLVSEKAHIAEFYKGKSVAEQNSVDLAWHLLMDDTYTELRLTIYQTDAELKRFRQLVVNSVMATDIVDKELKTLRNARWAKAFSEESANDNSRDATNRKATIVIEHLIQASDVAHTMQHWHIYRKWNERFFIECYLAYKDGRAEKNPAEGWYQGELGFYDFYIIPLAKKLKDCGVFGVSSDEYLNYAVRNRKEWEGRGREVVDEMIEIVNKRFGGSGSAAGVGLNNPY